MRLVALRPHWRHWATGKPPAWWDATRAIGVEFDCPVHGTAHRVYVDFANPFDGASPVDRQHRWTRTGATFETLSLTPSVDYTKWDNDTLRDPTCWHGFITNGEVT